MHLRMGRWAVWMAPLLLAACVGAGDDDGMGDAAAPGSGTAVAEAQPITGPVPRINNRINWSGQQSAAFNDMFVTAREERGWRLMWQLIGDEPPGPLPEDAMAVAVFLGARPSAGYQVAITDVLDDGDEVLVQYLETPPAPGATTAQILTAPYAVELVPLSTLPVAFETDG